MSFNITDSVSNKNTTLPPSRKRNADDQGPGRETKIVRVGGNFILNSFRDQLDLILKEVIIIDKKLTCALVCQEWRASVGRILQTFGRELKANLPKIPEFKNLKTVVSAFVDADHFTSTNWKLFSQDVRSSLGPKALTSSPMVATADQIQGSVKNANLLIFWNKLREREQSVPDLQNCLEIREWLKVNAKKFVYLSINNSELTALPEEIKYFTNLSTLVLNNNPHLAELTPEIGTLHNLKILLLQNTKISSLPNEIGSLSHLKTLDLSDTPLESLPDTICLLTQLEGLDISRTKIALFPDGFSSLTKLQLYNNQ